GVRAPLAGPIDSLDQHRRTICDGGQRFSDLSRISELWSQDSAEGLASLAESVCVRWMAGGRTAVASDIRVDLPGQRFVLCRVPGCERQLSAGAVYAKRCSRRVADGEALLLLRSQATGARGL